jgi:hypothetical protein
LSIPQQCHGFFVRLAVDFAAFNICATDGFHGLGVGEDFPGFEDGLEALG